MWKINLTLAHPTYLAINADESRQGFSSVGGVGMGCWGTSCSVGEANGSERQRPCGVQGTGMLHRRIQRRRDGGNMAAGGHRRGGGTALRHQRRMGVGVEAVGRPSGGRVAEGSLRILALPQEQTGGSDVACWLCEKVSSGLACSALLTFW